MPPYIHSPWCMSLFHVCKFCLLKNLMCQTGNGTMITPFIYVPWCMSIFMMPPMHASLFHVRASTVQSEIKINDTSSVPIYSKKHLVIILSCSHY